MDFLRVVADTGRIYYAETDKALVIHDAEDKSVIGFMTFRDVLTKETVRLENGTYYSMPCPNDEVDVRQHEWLADGTPPRVVPGFEPPRPD